jgi:hypothetical protein
MANNKQLELSLSKAKELYPTAPKEIKEIFEQTWGKKEFVKSIQDRIENLGDVYELVGYAITGDGSIGDKSATALLKLFKVVEAYNEGWKPDPKDSNQYKYWLYKYFSGGMGDVVDVGWSSSASVPLGLCFKSRELTLDSYNKFPELWEAYWQTIGL